MGKSHLGRNLGLGAGILIAGVVAFTFLGGELSAGGGEFNFQLPVPNQLLTQQELAGFADIEAPFGAEVATGITCKLKQTTTVFGVNTNNQIIVLATIESNGLGGSPFTLLAVSQTTDPTSDLTISYFIVEPKIFCSTAGDLPIEVSIREMSAYTFASYSGRVDLVQKQNLFGSKLLNFGQGEREQSLNEFIIHASDLEGTLPFEDLSVLYTFDLVGQINIEYKDFPQIFYQIPFTFDQVTTDYRVDVNRASDSNPIDCPFGTTLGGTADGGFFCFQDDTDGDGINDPVDLCPNNPEDFDGFEDGDGCPEFGSGEIPRPPTCSFGEVLENNVCVTDCTISSCQPVSCAEGNLDACQQNCIDQGGVPTVFNDVVTCELGVPQCTQNEVLVFDIDIDFFTCVPKEGTGDRDGDGILDALDQCPDLAEDLDGFEDTDGCPETGTGGGVEPPKPSDANLIDEVTKGDIVTLFIIRFEDNTVESSVGSARLGTDFQFPNLTSIFSNLVPAQLTGSTTGGEGKAIKQFEIEYFYFNDQSPPKSIEVVSKDLRLVLTIDQSSTSSADSNPVPLLGSIGTGELTPQTGQGGLLGQFGDGISLGRVTITSTSIVILGEQADIPSGQSRDADLIFSTSGFINFKDGDERERFLLRNSLIIIKDVDIDNQSRPVAEPKCTDKQLTEINPQTGEKECITPAPDTPTCFTNERPLGFACSPEDVQQFCFGNTQTCTEKDLDNDGVPDHRDECTNITKSDFKEDGLTANGSDPDDGCVVNKKQITVCNPLIEQCPERPEPPNGNGGNGGVFCSEENPDKCIIQPEDLLTIAIAGTVILIGIGVTVAIVRRRSNKVFGT